jgi:hypothetical protein
MLFRSGLRRQIASPYILRQVMVFTSKPDGFGGFDIYSFMKTGWVHHL